MNKKVLKIGIDANVLIPEQLTGIGKAVFQLINALEKANSPHKFYIYSKSKILNFKLANNNFQLIDVAPFFGKLRKTKLWYFIHYFFLLPKKLRKDKIDIFWGTHNNFFPLWFSSTIKKVFTVYDLVVKLYPETMSFLNKKLMSMFFNKNVKKADHIITISQSVKNELINIMNIDKTKITTVLLAADKHFFYQADQKNIEIIKNKYNIKTEYLISVCTLEPRKNISSVLKAYANLSDKSSYNLVLVGKLGWIKNFFTLIDDLGIKDSVIITGYVPEEDLAPLYSGAELFVYPSYYEGFGLPPLEAMQCGCPVITSNVSSLPEVVGESAIKINPNEIEKIKAAFEKILNNPDYRKNLSEMSLVQANNFSWEKSAKEIIELFERLSN